jgi:hypothetical protein
MAPGGDSGGGGEQGPSKSKHEPAVDLSEEDVQQGYPPETLVLGEYESQPYDPEPEREKLRGWIALILVGLLVAVVVFAFLTLWFGEAAHQSDLKALLDLIIAPIVGVVGAVTGFYFGGK